MSSLDDTPTTGGNSWPTDKPSNDARSDWNGGDAGAASFNGGGFDSQVNGDFGAGQDIEACGADGACRNCGQDGHFARDCTEPRKMGACFNCGEDGHSKVDCHNPRKFNGECRECGEQGHPASDCPNRKITCKICREEGHEAHDCTNRMVIDRSKIPDKTENEAFAMLKAASNTRDLDDFKEAVEILCKACSEMTYPRLEKEFRARKYNVYLIAMEKAHGNTITNVNLQGDIEKKYVVSYFFGEKPQRPSMKERWPKTPEENLERLADAGIPMDRGVTKCNNCGELGHTSRKCTEDKAEIDQPTVKCALCDQVGHRVRDCTQERMKPRAPRTCKVCESEEHIAKDCPNREKRACRNCGSEDHMAKECDQPRNPATIQCRNCDLFGHTSKECTAPRDYSRVTCMNCGEKGHTKVRCEQPPKEEEGDGGFGGGDNGGLGNNDSAAASGGKDWESAAPAAISGNNGWETAEPVAASGSAW